MDLSTTLLEPIFTKIKQKFYDTFLLTPEEKGIDRSLAKIGG